VSTGTGQRIAMFGSENQRCPMLGIISGVHRLTTAMNTSTPSSNNFACRRARSATSPSVFMISQVAPSSA